MDWTKIDDEELMAAFERELEPRMVEEIILSLNLHQIWVILAQLQLALSHPENNGPAASMVREFIVSVSGRVAPDGSAIAEVLRRGWPEYNLRGGVN